MQKLKMKSLDGVNLNIQKLRDVFPFCVTETKDCNGDLLLSVDFENLKSVLGITEMGGG